MVIHADQHQVSGLTADLETKTRSLQLNKSRSTPSAAMCPAADDSLPILPAKNESCFLKRRYYQDTGSSRRDVEGNALIRRVQQFMEHCVCGGDTVINLCRILGEE